MAKIDYIVNRREVHNDGALVMVSIKRPTSDLDTLSNDEILKMLNSIKRSKYLNPDAHVGFDYTFSIPLGDDVGAFPLAVGHGFPYVLDFNLEE